MKFNRIFLALVCSISLLGVACSDGDSTSSNTPSANNNGSADNNGGDEVSDDNNGGESETFTISSLGQSFTVTRGETSVSDVQDIRGNLQRQCSAQFDGVESANCRDEVVRATSIDALAFLNGI